ncbi:MAG: DUF1634 domain-containing protein [Candidatus Limnocylindrales bacterium]
MTGATGPRRADLDRTIARLLTIGTAVGIAFLVVGVVQLIAGGGSPLDEPPHGFEPSQIVPDLLAGVPDGALWVGLIVLIAMPASRVAASLIGFARAGERWMVAVSAAILVVIAAGVVIGAALGVAAGG